MKHVCRRDRRTARSSVCGAQSRAVPAGSAPEPGRRCHCPKKRREARPRNGSGWAAAARLAALGYDYEAQAKQPVLACNLCGATGSDVARRTTRDRYGYCVGFAVCRRCGLGWLSPRMTSRAYAHFYYGIYRPLVSAYHGHRIDAETVQRDQRAYATELAAFLEPRLASRPRTILDVGGSTGVVARLLATRLGARATVLDPAPRELMVAARAGVEAIAGFAEDFDARGRRWDLVLLCQTVDHLLDVRRTLVALRRMTSASGRAFVEILDADLVLRREGAIEQVLKVDHPYYLTRDSAIAFFTLAGYAVRAERESADGHRGFLLAPCVATEPDWPTLAAGAARFCEAAEIISKARSNTQNL